MASTPADGKKDPQKLLDLIETVRRLRAPDGCPWDREQTHQSLRPYLIEEAYEVLSVIDQIDDVKKLQDGKIRQEFREELGDLWLQVLLHSEMASETGAFNIYDVAQVLNEKLVRRHPHVFGDAKADSADAAYANWEQQKAAEKAKNPQASVLDGLPKALPQLQRAARLIEKVTKVGFQWPDMEGPLAKLEEELEEFKEIAANLPPGQTPDTETAAKLEHELGDVLFSICNLAFLMKANPEDALRTTLARFERRFRHVEKRLKEKGSSPAQSNLEEMDRYWDEAKALEK
ncbi:MAG: nucleoside triphosphate pyrophosphohydrolase [Bacteriovoracia bacterium]